MMHSTTSPSLVFLHGWLGDETEWYDVSSRLERWTSQHWTLSAEEHWQAAIEALVHRLPPQSVLIGYSLGARVALGCALHPQSQLAGLVLLSGNAGLEDEIDRETRWQHDLAVARRLRETDLIAFLEDWYNQPIFASAPDEWKQSWIRQRGSIDREHQARLLECFSVSRQPSYWPQLAQVTLPTLVLAGTKDDKYVSLARRMQAKIPHSEIRILADVGHAAHRENPQGVADCLAKWLQSQLHLLGSQTTIKEGRV